MVGDMMITALDANLLTTQNQQLENQIKSQANAGALKDYILGLSPNMSDAQANAAVTAFLNQEVKQFSSVFSQADAAAKQEKENSEKNNIQLD